MKKIWFSFAFVILIMSLLNPFSYDNESVALILILIHSIFVYITMMGFKNKKIKFILSGAFIARLVLMFWDIFGRNIFVLPNAGTDDDGFYIAAKKIATNLSLLTEDVYGGIYSKINGSIFYLTGSSRILGNYINVLLGISVVLIIYKILVVLKIKNRVLYYSLFFIAFLPNSVIMSAIFRREMAIIFFVTLSLYYFILWFLKGFNIHLVLSIIFLGIGSIFHSGIIGILAGYFFAFVFYKPITGKFKFSANSIIYFSFLSLFIIIVYLQFGDVFLAKFGNIEEVEDVFLVANRSNGEASYLTSISITTPLEFLVYTPIKAIYFLLSPLPWDWRSSLDIISFLFDSMFYLVVVFCFFKNKKYFDTRSRLITCIMICIFVTIIIFGVGVGNAGTAMRHRQKLLPLFIVVFSLIFSEKKIFFDKQNKKKLNKAPIVKLS